MSDVPTGANRGVRVGLMVLGAAMWVAVFAVLYVKWQSGSDITTEQPEGSTPVPINVPVFRAYQLPAFSLIDQNKRPVTKSDLAGQPWVASFLFTRCTTHCPRVAAELEKLQKSLGDLPVRFVTITVDPENDTPDVLKRWAESLRADAARWKFLTGEPQAVSRLLREGFQISAMPNTGADRTPGNEISHSQSVLLVDAGGTVIGKYDGANEIDLNRLRRDLREAEKKRQAENSNAKTAAKSGSRTDE